MSHVFADIFYDRMAQKKATDRSQWLKGMYRTGYFRPGP